MHKSKMDEYQKYKAQWRRPECAPRIGGKRKFASDGVASTDPPLRQTKLRSVDAVSQKNVDKLVTNFIVKGMHAVSMVEQPEFIELVNGLSPSATVMSRRTLTRRIDDMCIAKLQELKIVLADTSHVCTTADIWSTSKRSYIGVTCHWLEPETLDRRSAALACRRFAGAHTYDRIAEMLYEINNDFGLSHIKIVATVSDNGANFVKAFKEFNVHVLYGDDDDDDDGNDVNNSNVEVIVNDDDSLVDETFVNFVSIDDSVDDMRAHGSMVTGQKTEQSDIVLPTHIRCASHTLSLVGTTDANKALKNSAAFSRINHAAMGKCSALWNTCNRPKSAEIIKEICGCDLITPCTTRWNSLYDSVKKVLEKREFLQKLMAALKLPCFKDVELDFLDEYVQTLAPIAVALDRLQGDKMCYYANLLPTIFTVSNKLNSLQTVNFRHCSPLLHAVTTGFHSRFASFLNLTPEVNMAIIATVTHPYFKLRWLPTQFIDQTQRIQSLLLTTARNAGANPNASDVASASAPNQDESDDDYFGFTHNNSHSRTDSTQQAGANKLELEILQYLDDTRREIGILHSYPNVKKLFLEFNAVLPSSAPVERLFSFAGIITRPNRRRLSDKLFEQLLLLKAD
jgi:hypothetical protein